MPEPIVAYASCWEDIDYAATYFERSAYDRILSVCSGGDNTLALLPLARERVVAVDLHAEQLHLLKLKVACLRTLQCEAAQAFLGVRDAPDRLLMYRGLRAGLPDEARRFWDAHPRHVAAGVLNAGKLDRYFDGFRRYVMPLIHGRALARELLFQKTAEAQAALYRERWDTRRWRALFQVFFARRTMGLLGRDPAKFTYAEGSLAGQLLAQSADHLSSTHALGNGFLHYLLVGGFGPYLPPYLRPERYDVIREHLGKLSTFHGPAQEAPIRNVGLFNLSNIFEYMDLATARAVGEGLRRRATPGAECFYWNMTVERDLAEVLPEGYQALHAATLGRADWGFFYRAFRHARVRQHQMDTQ